ncbi:Protein of unknown function [Afipia sp. GAS231]|nr:Protein of unknown function [Afipia sp. GAS231]
MQMNKLGMTLLCSLVLIVSAGASELAIEPGQWKVTSTTVMNGATSPPGVKARCLTPEQAGDVAKTFGPVSGTVNSTCEPAESEVAGRTLKWHLQCRGQLDLDVLGSFNFDSPSHYTATVISKGRMAGQLISDVKTEIEGERVGECQ